MLYQMLSGRPPFESPSQSYLEIVLGHLPEPQLILRLVACLTDRASDRYLASSELASFGVRMPMALIILGIPNRYLPVFAGKGPGS